MDNQNIKRLIFILMIVVQFCSILSQTDFYNVLGVHRSANKKDIKQAFRQKAKQYHPDKNPDADANQRFIDLKEAYDTLSESNKRKKFDRLCKTCGLTWFEIMKTKISFRSPLQMLKDFFRSLSEIFREGLNSIECLIDYMTRPQPFQLTFSRPVSRPGECNCREDIVITRIGNGMYQMKSQFICSKCY